ncbi:MAG: glycosyl hydrolase family 95 catalytic domain-containing protein [Ruminococcus sp.]
MRLWDDVPKISAETSQYDLRERLAAFHEGASDPELYAILFAFGKYLLISSSRPGTQAANLQGIWSNDIIPPWFSDFTVKYQYRNELLDDRTTESCQNAGTTGKSLQSAG